MFNLIQLTRANGERKYQDVFVNPAHLVSVKQWEPELSRINLLHDETYNVKETPEQIMEKIRQAVIPATLDHDY